MAIAACINICKVSRFRTTNAPLYFTSSGMVHQRRVRNLPLLLACFRNHFSWQFRLLKFTFFGKHFWWYSPETYFLEVVRQQQPQERKHVNPRRLVT